MANNGLLFLLFLPGAAGAAAAAAEVVLAFFLAGTLGLGAGTGTTGAEPENRENAEQGLSQDSETGCPKLAIVKYLGIQFQGSTFPGAQGHMPLDFAVGPK